jgi:hypothetical protein
LEIIAKLIEQYGPLTAVVTFLLVILIKSDIEIRIKYENKNNNKKFN